MAARKGTGDAIPFYTATGDIGNGHLVVLPDADAVAEKAARLFVALSAEAVRERGRFTVALSGGSTPQALYPLLAQSPWREQIAWQQLFLFWGDERFVPPDHPDSAGRMARQALLDHVPVPAQNIFPMVTRADAEKGEQHASATAAAGRYEALLCRFFAPDAPRLNLVLLGMGADGHTASLFPGHRESADAPLVTAVFNAPKPPPIRLTLSYQAINQAANILFLVTGGDKATALARMATSHADSADWPAGRIRPVIGRLLWLADREAAALIPQI